MEITLQPSVYELKKSKAKRDDFYLSGYSVSSPALVTVISLSSDSSEPSCGQLNTTIYFGFLITKSFPTDMVKTNVKSRRFS
jgi:hypothetical protein